MAYLFCLNIAGKHISTSLSPCAAELFVPVFSSPKLELVTQFPVSNDEEIGLHGVCLFMKHLHVENSIISLTNHPD